MGSVYAKAAHYSALEIAQGKTSHELEGQVSQ